MSNNIRIPVRPQARRERAIEILAKQHKSFVRKQKSENILIAIIMTPVIIVATLLSIVVVFIMALFPLIKIGLGIWALVFGISDLVNVGFNGWAVAWIVVGAILILSGLFKRSSD